MKLTVEMVRSNLAYYMSKHVPLTEDEIRSQFNEWLLDLTEQIIEVREAQIIKVLENDYWHHIYYPPQEHYATKTVAELVTAHTNSCIGCELIAVIKGEQK